MLFLTEDHRTNRADHNSIHKTKEQTALCGTAMLALKLKVVWHIGCQIRFYDKYCCSTRNNQSDHISIHKTKEQTTLCGTAME